MIVSDLQPNQNLTVVRNLGKHFNAGTDLKRSWIKFVIENGFSKIEKSLEKTSGRYCFGNTLTMADICLVPQAVNAVRSEIDLNNYPKLSKIVQNLELIPEFETTHPRYF
eukprot:TRINITY_DN1417_c1_g2_i4.p3 TRINITY_DN1417_c1_g2~~TRINITY_DN1417_c1_g2_i4.p3  ORF type:complete len:110 (+),score=24.58 TRINITY_DN1417_c1_g2_i4:467-796(+)